jgi:hypothetical protein
MLTLLYRRTSLLEAVSLLGIQPKKKPGAAGGMAGPLITPNQLGMGAG